MSVEKVLILFKSPLNSAIRRLSISAQVVSVIIKVFPTFSAVIKKFIDAKDKVRIKIRCKTILIFSLIKILKRAFSVISFKI